MELDIYNPAVVVDTPGSMSVETYCDEEDKNTQLGFQQFVRCEAYSSYRGLRRVKVIKRPRKTRDLKQTDGTKAVQQETEHLYIHRAEKSHTSLPTQEEVKGHSASGETTKQKSERVVDRINKIRPLSLQISFGKIVF